MTFLSESVRHCINLNLSMTVVDAQHERGIAGCSTTQLEMKLIRVSPRDAMGH